MKIRARQFFFLAILLPSIPALAAPEVGRVYALKLADVDGNNLSTADGHITVFVVTTKPNVSKAQLVGDRIPDLCLGNPAFRMITLVKFGQHNNTVRSFLAAMTRRRLDAEGRSLQKRYDAKNIARPARRDVFAVADFEGNIAAQLGSASADFLVLVFGPAGELRRQWDDVPSAASLAEVLR